jgi:non-homologous end joining protein Ku
MNDGTAVAAEAEAVLVEAMKGKIGIGTLSRGGRQKQVAVRVYGEGFVIHTLRSSDQMKAMPDRPALPKANAQMVTLARQLVASMEGDLDLSEHEDEYANGLRALVAAKAGGVVVAPAAEPPKPKVSSLLEALQKSLESPAAKKKAEDDYVAAHPQTKAKQRKRA